MLGIYSYIDKQTNEIVYVGKDSHINKQKRHKAHHHQSNKDMQTINKVLQSNPNRYTYQVLNWNVTDQDTLNALEIQYIRQLNPKFNFTDGGEGVNGYKHSDERKEKMRKAKLGKKLSEETRKKMSDNNAKYWLGKKRDKSTIQKIVEKKKGKSLSESTLKNMSKAKNSSGFFRVYKVRNPKCKQGFTFVYSYYDNGKRVQIRNVNLKKLEKIVKDRGLDWCIINNENAKQTLNELEGCIND